VRLKLDLDPKGEVNVILGQVLINLWLAMEFSGLRVEIYADPGSKLRPLPFLLYHSLALARTADSTIFASLHHL